MAEIFIISDNGYCFADGECEIAPAIEKTGDSLSSDPLSFMPDVENSLKTIAHTFVQNALKMCIPKESMQLSYIWRDGDAKALAQQIMHSGKDRFVQYAKREGSSPFIAMTLSQLAITSRGDIVAASILKELMDPNLGVSILFDMENPARAARVLNLWKMMSVGESDKITLALNHASTSGERMQIYEYGANINAELFYNPLNALQVSEKVLIGFDEYETRSNGSNKSSWEKFLLLQRARKKLEEHLSNLVTKNLIEPCRISYSSTGRINEMECPLIPPPFPKEENDPIIVNQKDFSYDPKRVERLIDDYEYCEAIIDEIADRIISAQYQPLESGKIYDTVDLMINLEHLINDIEETESKMRDEGYDLPTPNNPQELRLLLEEIDDEFIDIENDAIDREMEQRLDKK